MIKYSFNLKWLIVAVICTIVLLCLTHLPPQVLPSGWNIRGLDKAVHFCAYAGITLMCFLSIKNKVTIASILTIFLCLSVLGAIDELTQPFVNRTADCLDYLADIIGVVIVLTISLLLQVLKAHIIHKSILKL